METSRGLIGARRRRIKKSAISIGHESVEAFVAWYQTVKAFLFWTLPSLVDVEGEYGG